ncbi:substrate-binding domain-containing protein [Paenibacillus naphthalenovorans]|uniref:substrate-binding domain-containing protein n=1 Tax=Paenibacillus naphthalenovorans TaxID=162209 RepID=UPI00088A5945|nr:substrate-binding domain-containing protein [Paenibacillus naphthalenovorans]SDJ78743.1 substrate-binding protein-like domain-containing protein [Paenibacillus naphthalenovorans]
MKKSAKSATLACLLFPEVIATIGYDGVEFSQYAEVPLTTVLYNVEEVARCSVNLLFRLLDSRNLMSSLAPVKMKIEPVLAVRESCGMNKRKPIHHL